MNLRRFCALHLPVRWDVNRSQKLAQEHFVLELVLLTLRKSRNEDPSGMQNKELLLTLRQRISVYGAKNYSGETTAWIADDQTLLGCMQVGHMQLFWEQGY